MAYNRRIASETSLRKAIIRLAQENPDGIRRYLVPLINKVSAEGIRLTGLHTRLEVDVSVYQSNIKVHLTSLMGGTVSQADMLKWVKGAPAQAKQLESRMIQLPFDVGIRSTSAGFQKSTYESIWYIDLSVDRTELIGPTGDAFLKEMKPLVQRLGGKLWNKGTAV